MKYLLVAFLFFIVLEGSAQKHEFGAGFGATNYKGDFTNDNFDLRNYRPGLLCFYKNNITPAVGIRYHFMMGGIKASDSKSPDAVYVQRDESFRKSIYELGAEVEYNFLNYRSESNKLQWSPYFSGGGGVFYFPSYPGSGTLNVQPCIPIGIGIKMKLKHHWNFIAEAVARKTFGDLLDNANGATSGGNSDTQDWYFYNGVSVSYTFYSVYCPKPYR
jgi:hypothetical protein